MDFSAGGSKGLIPQGSGTPFYTTSANPQSCPAMRAPATCEKSWLVVPTGQLNSQWAFFSEAIPHLSQVQRASSPAITLTILKGPLSRVAI